MNKAAITKPNCAMCKFWEQSAKGQYGWKFGLGKCANVPMFYDATEDPNSDDPEDLGDESRVLKPDCQGVKAVALDGSGYRAELLTMPDFGCVSYSPK